MSLQVRYEDAIMGQQVQYRGQCQGFSDINGLSYLPERNLSPYCGVCSLERNSWRLEGWSEPAYQIYIPDWGAVLSDEKGGRVFSMQSNKWKNITVAGH